MTKWDHLVVNRCYTRRPLDDMYPELTMHLATWTFGWGEPNTVSLADLLDELGGYGWELVTVLAEPDGVDPDTKEPTWCNRTFFFKRPIPESPSEWDLE